MGAVVSQLVPTHPRVSTPPPLPGRGGGGYVSFNAFVRRLHMNHSHRHPICSPSQFELLSLYLIHVYYNVPSLTPRPLIIAPHIPQSGRALIPPEKQTAPHPNPSPFCGHVFFPAGGRSGTCEQRGERLGQILQIGGRLLLYRRFVMGGQQYACCNTQVDIDKA